MSFIGPFSFPATIGSKQELLKRLTNRSGHPKGGVQALNRVLVTRAQERANACAKAFAVYDQPGEE